MGKLVDKLERLQKSAAPRLGFGPAVAAKQPSMALIAVLSSLNAQHAAAAVQAGADALVVQSGGSGADGSLPEALGVAETLPCGVMLADGAQGAPSCDFAVARMSDPLGTLLEADKVDKLVRLDGDIADPLLRTLESLPIEGVVLSEPAAPLTFQELARYYRVTKSTSKVVLAMVPATVDRSVLRALRDSGVSGVLVGVDSEAAAKALAALRKAIDEMPPKRKAASSRARPSPSLGLTPSPQPEAAPAAPDEPDEPDPDDE